MGEEIELKLELDPKHAQGLAHEGLLRGAEQRSERLVSVYYDTPAGKLRKHGYSLRVRSTPDGYVQTVKSLDPSAGLFFRGEWEVPVDSLEPHVEELARTPAGGLRPKKLHPVVCSAVNRTLWRVLEEGSELEVSLDAGDVHADGRDEAVCELEIELKRGQPSAAFEAARKIADHVPLRLGVMSKAERGFALAEGVLDKVHKAGLVPLRPDMSVAEGFAVIVRSCLRHFRLNEPLLVKERKADALHQARVAMRRLRSALTLFRPALAGEEFDRLREELRWFTGQLGDARNLDVYLERDNPKQQQRKRLLRQREKAYHQLIDALNTPRFRLLMIDLMAWATVGEWRSGEKASRPLADFAERRISRLWLKICCHDNIKSMGAEERHQLRIEIKKLRYALDFMQALHQTVGRRQKQFTKAIESLQEALGRLNDIVTARHLVESNDNAAEEIVTDEEVKCVHEAQKCLNRLKLTGPYWTKARDVWAS